MEYAYREPEVSPESVRTLPQGILVRSVGSPLCPICEQVELRGRKTVCSAACRRERSRQRQAAELRADVASIGQALEVLRTHHDALDARVSRLAQRSRGRAAGGLGHEHGARLAEEPADLTQHFHRAMLGVFERVSAACPGYRPTYFLRMVVERGGLDAARALLAEQRVLDGFTELWNRHRLDLSMEALVLEPRWRSLFTTAELAEARRRLIEAGHRLT
jgi:hypothetical protein